MKLGAIAAELATISSMAAAMAAPFGYTPARRMMRSDIEKTDKRQDKAARNKRKQQKASRRKNRR